MRHFIVTAAIAAFLSTPARSQDIAGEFAAAARTFLIPGESPQDGEAAMAEAVIRAQAVSGAWIPAIQLAGQFRGPEDMGRLADVVTRMDEFCTRLTLVATPVSPRNFEWRTHAQGEDTGFAITFQFVGGRSYQLSVDETALLERFGFDEAAGRPPFPTIYSSIGAGVVEVFLPSPNVLIVQPQGVSAELYLRCPG